jgi:hypothetical protein
MKVQPTMQCCPATKFHYLTMQSPWYLRNIKLWRITILCTGNMKRLSTIASIFDFNYWMLRQYRREILVWETGNLIQHSSLQFW